MITRVVSFYVHGYSLVGSKTSRGQLTHGQVANSLRLDRLKASGMPLKSHDSNIEGCIMGAAELCMILQKVYHSMTYVVSMIPLLRCQVLGQHPSLSNWSRRSCSPKRSKPSSLDEPLILASNLQFCNNPEQRISRLCS